MKVYLILLCHIGADGCEDGCHRADIFNVLFLYENSYISIKNEVKLVTRGQVSNKLSLTQIIAWHKVIFEFVICVALADPVSVIQFNTHRYWTAIKMFC